MSTLSFTRIIIIKDPDKLKKLKPCKIINKRSGKKASQELINKILKEQV